MRLDLESLRALDALVRAGGFAGAAARLNKVQSAVSYQIRKLEERLGVALVDRRGYRVRLTSAGEAVLAEGRRLLAQAEQVEALARHFVGGFEPRLVVIVDGILPLAPTFRALKLMADEGIPTRIQIKVEYLYGVQYRFDRDSADLMLVKDFAPSPWLQAEAFPDVDCVLCVARGHPLACRSGVSLLELQEHVELSVQDSADRGNDRHMFGGERVFYLSGFMAKKEALLMGLGFGWMPMYMVAAELKSGALRELRYAGGSRYRFTPSLVHRLDRPLGRAGQRLAALLREQARLPPGSRRVRTRSRRLREKQA
jgi:DNA-binding transcriptional LysR family regulator